MGELSKAVLVLADGTVFHGKAVGKIGKTAGELVYNTAMSGYQEAITDPNYYGQLLLFTVPHIGNIGITTNESSSDRGQCNGLIVKKFAEVTSRDLAEASLQEFLVSNDIVGISDVDTRAIVHHLRENGTMNAIISSGSDTNIDDLLAEVQEVPPMEGQELASKVSTKQAYVSTAINEECDCKVAVVDFGTHQGIVHYMNKQNYEVKVFPMSVSVAEIIAYQPEGIILSDGPGDPAAMTSSHQLVKEIIETNLPVFGFGLGHQLIACSQGVETEKMMQGHRGSNHPVIHYKTGKSEITTQNHGFVVSRISAEDNENIEITHAHLNDNTVAGITLKNKPVFSVQYRPDGFVGPRDSMYLIDQFIENMNNN